MAETPQREARAPPPSPSWFGSLQRPPSDVRHAMGENAFTRQLWVLRSGAQVAVLESAHP
eukprot:4775305-Alexandrium_andersonii.AAC.1